MKALFIGLGSIGQRHLSNFREIAGKGSEVLVYRSTNHNILISNGTGEPCGSLEQHYGCRTFTELDKALAERPDAVFVTNPTSKHLEVALKAAEKGCNLFIEKPLSHNLDKVGLLEDAVKEGGIIVMVGYQTRFHPCYKDIHDILSNGTYGKVISAGFEWGTYLPSHHPYEDYRLGYAAKKDLGGGVILGLSHELDVICSFWGLPDEIHAVGGKLSPLEMDTEDTVSALMEFKVNGHRFPVSLFLSYAQTKESHMWRVQLEEATIFCDLTDNTVGVFGRDGNAISENSYPDLKRNDLYLFEIKHFLKAVQERWQPSVSLYDGIECLNLAARIKESING